MEDQRGKFMSFVLVGVILLSLLTGGLYVAKLYSAQTPQQPKAPTEKNPKASPVAEKEKQPTPQEESEPSTMPTQQHNSAPTAQVGAATIPASGPTEIASLVVLGILTYSAVFYWRSRASALT